MGRYLTIDGEADYKFWVGSQPTSDILDFGHETETITGCVLFEDLERIKADVEEKKQEFYKKFKITYEEFIKKIEAKGYLASSDDEETNTEEWAEMESKGAWICLGEHIIKKLEEKGDDLLFEAEN